MKKIFYVIVIALASSFALTSCTEEEVRPDAASSLSNGGGGSMDKN